MAMSQEQSTARDRLYESRLANQRSGLANERQRAARDRAAAWAVFWQLIIRPKAARLDLLRAMGKWEVADDIVREIDMRLSKIPVKLERAKVLVRDQHTRAAERSAEWDRYMDSLAG